MKIELLVAVKILIKSLAFLVFIGLSSCGPESSTQQVKPPKAIPANPNAHVLSLEKTLVTEKTRKVYQWYCTQCHGVDGHGDGVNASHLVVPPRDHTKASYLETRSDQQLFEAVKLGGLAVGRAPCMPAWEHTLDDKTIHSLVGYIRELCECKAL